MVLASLLATTWRHRVGNELSAIRLPHAFASRDSRGRSNQPKETQGAGSRSYRFRGNGFPRGNQGSSTRRRACRNLSDGSLGTREDAYWSSDGSSAPASAISCSATFANTTLSFSHLCAASWRSGGKLSIALKNSFFSSSSIWDPPYFQNACADLQIAVRSRRGCNQAQSILRSAPPHPNCRARSRAGWRRSLMV